MADPPSPRSNPDTDAHTRSALEDALGDPGKTVNMVKHQMQGMTLHPRVEEDRKAYHEKRRLPRFTNAQPTDVPRAIPAQPGLEHFNRFLTQLQRDLLRNQPTCYEDYVVMRHSLHAALGMWEALAIQWHAAPAPAPGNAAARGGGYVFPTLNAAAGRGTTSMW